MKVAEFSYELPGELIAQAPLAERSASRLLVLERDGEPRDGHFREIVGLLRPEDLLVVNDTRVIPARLFAVKPTGGRVEILLERVLEGRTILAQARSSKPLRAGQVLALEDGAEVTVGERRGGFREFEFPREADVAELFERLGHVPLPPYIARQDTALDRERYQTVYARRPGAVAAPTAGLHFDEALLAELEEKGVRRAGVTLHVGAGTFQPVRCEEVEAHEMHRERIEVSAATCEAVAAARARGGRVVAVGTTVVRALESAAQGGALAPMAGESDLFIFPGHRFRVVDALVTNFHLPRSTLLMLVCAFGGKERVLAAYRHAVERGYRFFSYGDAMFLERA